MARKRSTTRKSSMKRSSGARTTGKAGAPSRGHKASPSGRKSAARSRRGGATSRSARTARASAGRGGAERQAAPRAGGRATRVSGGMPAKGAARAKWVASTQDHEDRPGQTLATRDHAVIRQWAEARGAEPATAGRGHGGRPRTLRFDFPGYGGKSLTPVSWDDWFRTFDERDLVFLFQEHLSNGRTSNFFRLDNPQREAA